MEDSSASFVHVSDADLHVAHALRSVLKTSWPLIGSLNQFDHFIGSPRPIVLTLRFGRLHEVLAI